jgi:hypothetical protein
MLVAATSSVWSNLIVLRFRNRNGSRHSSSARPGAANAAVERGAHVVRVNAMPMACTTASASPGGFDRTRRPPIANLFERAEFGRGI